MVGTERLEQCHLNERDLPKNIDYFVITDKGSLVESTQPRAVVYVDEFDVQRLTDPNILLYIRARYGPYIGVMHEVRFNVQPRQFKTQKVLLGLVKP